MQAPGDTPEIRVLLVDDEEDDYLITSEALAECPVAHYDVTWSSSFDDAQQQLSSNTFDLCLADYYLGCHTGLDLLNALGEVPLARRAPLILLTGAGDRTLDLKAMELGAADYLLKSELRSNLLERAIRHAIERHDAQRKLYQLARYDHLTGLPNRANFRESLIVALHRARRNCTTAALLFVDIDHFKPVNDTMGHDAGDELLQVAAGRMLNSVRVVDAVSRLGGDEFTVVLEDIADAKDVAIVADRIKTALSRPFLVNHRRVQLSASIGVALFPQDGDSADLLLTRADSAMYQVKKAGRDAYQFFCPAIEQGAQDKQTLRSALHEALQNQEFRVYYQPQYDVMRRCVVGVEALLYWQYGDVLMTPGELLPLLDEFGLRQTVGAWMLEQTCRDLHAWFGAQDADISAAIKISPSQLRDTELATAVRLATQEAGIHPSVLELEITQSVLVEDATAEAALHAVADTGVRIVVDDFGTGYCSLTYLEKLPIMGIKVDPSFVADYPTADDGRIATAIIALGHSLGLRVGAAGIQTQTQLNFVRSHGADVVQGEFFGASLTAEACGRLLCPGLDRAA